MITDAPHPLVEAPPGGLCWKRSERRRHASAPEAHRELVVLLGLAGSAEYLVDGKVYKLGAGSLLWALAGQSHYLLSDEPGFDMWVLLISDQILTPRLRRRSKVPPLALRERPDGLAPCHLGGAELAELDALASYQREAPDHNLQAIGLRWWLGRAWMHWQNAPQGDYRVLHPAVDRAARAWQSDPTRSLDDVAGDAGLSPGRLGRVFKEQTGQSVVGFRTTQKLARVDAILDEAPQTPLLNAALDAGFGSYAQFFRAHRQMRGTSPSGRGSGATG